VITVPKEPTWLDVAQRPPASSPPAAGRFGFGDLVLDLGSGELWRDGEPLPLRPLAAKALQLLVANRDRLVTREELRHHLWGAAALEWETGLYQVIRQLRRAIGDGARAGGLIVTVPRRGYRWNARVVPLASVAASPGTLPRPPGPASRQRRPAPRIPGWRGAGLFLAGAVSLPLLVILACLLAGL